MLKSKFSFSDTERTIFVALSAVPGIGRVTLLKLAELVSFGRVSWQDIWNGVGLQGSKKDSLSDFRQKYTPENYWETLQQKSVEVVLPDDLVYPKLLREIPDQPLVLFVKGPTNFWDELPIAVVGTRRITSYGQEVTEKITRELVEEGATIISGFMYGVDMTAHFAAVKNDGRSVAVLGFGFDHFYPASYARCSAEFLAKGNTIITEFAPEVGATRGSFPVRNRIVAGMSWATVVVEAAEKSGSLITARLALDYNRVVCGVPGAITSIYSEGTRQLINEGAVLVNSGRQVLMEVGESGCWRPRKVPEKVVTPEETEKSQQEKDISAILKVQHLNMDELSQKLHRPIQELSVSLSLMELKGAIMRVGQKWRLPV